MAPTTHQLARGIDNEEATVERRAQWPQLERGIFDEFEALDG